MMSLARPTPWFSYIGHIWIITCSKSLHHSQDTQLSAQKVLREPPTVDHMMDIEFPYWTAPIWIFVIILSILL